MRTSKIPHNIPKPGQFSRLTMCLGCHLLVEMVAGDVAWHCPRCAQQYQYRHWKIRVKVRERKPAQPEDSAA